MARKKTVPINQEPIKTDEPKELPIICTYGLHKVRDGMWQSVKLETQGDKVVNVELGEELHRGYALAEVKVMIMKKWGIME